MLKTEIEKPQFNEPKRDKEWATFEEGYEVKRIPLDKHLPDKFVTISATLSTEEEKELLDFLNKNKDVFAWSAGDLRGVSRDIVEHHLDIRSGTKPKTQRPHKMPDEKASTVKAEVQRLLDVKVIREVKYPTWLANTVSVKKKNGK